MKQCKLCGCFYSPKGLEKFCSDDCKNESRQKSMIAVRERIRTGIDDRVVAVPEYYLRRGNISKSTPYSRLESF